MSAKKMHADEVDIDIELVRRLLAGQFSHWADLPLKRFASSGTVNAIYRIGEDMCADVRMGGSPRTSGLRQAIRMGPLGLLRGQHLGQRVPPCAVIDWGSVHVGDAARDITGVWGMLSRSGRDVFRDALSIDDATWARARAWAIRAVGGIHYYRETNRRHMQDCLDAIREVLADITPP